MADFAPNATARYRVRYSTAGLTHNMTFRYDLPASPPAAATIAGVDAFLTASKLTRFVDWTVLGESWCPQGGTAFFPLPITLSPDAGTVVLGTAHGQGPMFYSYVGLTAFANHARIMLFGIGNLPITAGGNAASNWRITTAESAEVAGQLTALAAIPDLVGIDSQPVNWHQYVNMKEHSHFVYQLRS